MKHPEPTEKTWIRTTLSVVQFPLDRKSKELHIRTDHVQVLTDYNRGHKSRAAITLQGGGGEGVGGQKVTRNPKLFPPQSGELC